ncbi:MAG: hypothetical protein ACI9R3_002929 [Verrucomicrobiales bacterium]|jgi:hypothetical protein
MNRTESAQKQQTKSATHHDPNAGKTSLPNEGFLRLAAAIAQVPEEVILARLLCGSV